MLMEKERQDLIDYGIKLCENNLTKGTGGNLSIFDRTNKLMAITPSGIDFYQIKLQDIVIMDLDGNIVEGTSKPSSEWEMHLLQYKTRTDMDAVIHGHTMYSTVLACLREELPSSHYMIEVAGGPNIRVADYATFGTPELAENATKAMKDRKAVLLANHGILAGDKDLLNAFNVIEEIEYCSELYVKAKSIGNPFILPSSEMDIMEQRFEEYGQKHDH